MSIATSRPSRHHAGAMPHDRRMPLRRRQQILDAVVDHLDRAAGFARQQRRMAGDHRRVFFLAAEAAAGFGLHDAHAIARQPEQNVKRPVHVVRDTAASRTPSSGRSSGTAMTPLVSM